MKEMEKSRSAAAGSRLVLQPDGRGSGIRV
jgi:hypothetical protein